MSSNKRMNILSWPALVITTLLACFWAFWGATENFHEGWYYDSMSQNIQMMLVQYWSFAIILITLNGIAIKNNRLGSILFVLTGIVIPAFIVNSSASVFIFGGPMVIAGILFWFGEFKNQNRAFFVGVMIPIFILIGFSIPAAYRVSQRIDDHNYEARTVKGNEVELVWAPEGPGWPTQSEDLTYKSWNDIQNICAHLSEDGKTLSDQELNIWRLPTVEEVVRSLTYHGENAGGIWNSSKMKPEYKSKPDKESPLWKVHSPIIYWYTGTEINDSLVFRIVYDGSVQTTKKTTQAGSLGFRAVKEVKK